MRIQDFPRPKNDTGRGIHWSASTYHQTGRALDFWLAELQAMKISWVKVLDDSGGSSLDVCQRLLGVGIMPVVRLYRPEPNPGTIGGREEDTIRRLVAAGVRYFETNNEPDLPVEWKNGKRPADWVNIVVDNFIVDADKVLGLGGLPAYPALGVGNRFNVLEPVLKKGRADLFEKGVWIAVHNYTLNHPLNYPFDAVNQEGAPVSVEEYERLGSWAWDSVSREQINAWRASDKNPGDTLEDDPSCFLVFHLIDQMATKALGHSVPIISTEGGPIVGQREDRRYPRMTPAMHAQFAVEIAEFLQGNREIHGIRRPDSYFTACHWLIANYRMGFLNTGWETQAWYSDWWNTQFNLKGQLPAVAALKNLPAEVVKSTERGVIAGRVLRTDTGQPLPDISISLLLAGKEYRLATAGPDGSFRFEGLTPGMVFDLAISPWGTVKQKVTAAVEPVQAIEILLTGGQTSAIQGVVHTAQDAAAAGLRVGLLREGTALAETTTGKDGTFRFERLALGSYRLTMPGITIDGISLDGWQTKSLKLTQAAASGLRYANVTKRLLSAEETGSRRLFYGVVTDPANLPLNGIKLEMRWEGAPAGTKFPTVISGSSPYKPAGYYEFLHTPGKYTIAVAQSDYPADAATELDTANVKGREGKPITYEVNFRLQLPQNAVGQIDGVVAGATAGRKVLLYAAGQAQPRETSPAANGAFAFRSLSPGNYRLVLETIGTIADDIVLPSGGLWKVFFPMKSSVRGKVTGGTAGLMAVLHAPAALGWTRQATVSATGEFSFENLPRGRYRLAVGARTLTDLVLTGENELKLATIDLVEGSRSIIRGRVATAAGAAQKDVTMVLRREGVALAQLKTGADGLYRFANLGAGVYTLEAVGLGQIGGNITLDGVREHVVDVVWPSPAPRGTIQGRVLAQDGQVQANVKVRLFRDSVEVAQQQTQVSGSFRFAGLAAGIYALAAGTGTPLVTGLRLEDGATLTRDITLPPATAKELSHYLLVAQPPAGQPGSATARLIARLLLHHLPAGTLAGFSVEEALHASKVTLLGDAQSADEENRLKAAGCDVSRIKGDGYAVAAALEQMFAEG